MGYAGIDYGMGMTNVDRATGIRYGVISQHSLDMEVFDFSTTPTFPGPNCPKCGGDVLPSEDVRHADLWRNRTQWGCFDYACLSCRKGFDSGECYGEEANGWECDDTDYELTPCLDSDVMVLKSPYYTYAQFCSPCVPGAGNLDHAMEDGVKTFALGHEWFDGETAPYPVYRVADDSRVAAGQLALAL